MSGLFGGGSSFKEMPNPATGLQALQMQNIGVQQGLYEEQAQLAQREAMLEAGLLARQVRNFREEQALGYTQSGVLLEGSPVKVLNDTVRQGQMQVQAIMARGAAQASLLRTQAYILGNEGRASILGQNLNYATSQAQAKMQAAAQPSLFAKILGAVGGAALGGIGGSIGRGVAGLFTN